MKYWNRKKTLMFIFITLISTTTFARTAEKFIMGSIGDSITTAMNSNGWGERKPYNWSTGTTKNKAIRSHFHKIKKRYLAIYRQ